MKTFRYLIAGLLLLAALPSQSKEEEISVSRSWGKLSGTLTVPDEGSDAAVLIIAGSGPTDRNGNSGSGLITNTYYMLARALEKEGIASLRYDKQGIGGSRYQDPELYKQEDRLRLADYIADAEALTDYLKERGFRKIILAGHSEGSLVALVAATESPDVAAVISLAGAGYPIDEILQFQLTRELAAAGVKPDVFFGFRDAPYCMEEYREIANLVKVSTDTGAVGFHGFVTQLYDPADYDVVLVCGPTVMMKNAARLCAEKGTPCFVSMEKKMACGIGACLGCTCETRGGEGKSVCKNGPVFDATEVFF